MTKKTIKRTVNNTVNAVSGAAYGATKATVAGVYDILKGTVEVVIAPVAAVGGAVAGTRSRSPKWNKIEDYLHEYKETKENEG